MLLPPRYAAPILVVDICPLRRRHSRRMLLQQVGQQAAAAAAAAAAISFVPQLLQRQLVSSKEQPLQLRFLHRAARQGGKESGVHGIWPSHFPKSHPECFCLHRA